MAKKESKVFRPGSMTEGNRSIIQGLLREALKDLLGSTIEGMMEAEMDEHLGYGHSERSDNEDSRNGYKSDTKFHLKC